MSLPMSSPFLAPSVPIVLASGSAVRRQLLEQAGVPVSVRPVDVDEPALRRQAQKDGMTIEATARLLAEAKAEAGARALLLQRELPPDSVVIGADQILEQDGRIFSKPADRDEARAQLRTLRGTTQRLHTAVAIRQSGALVWSGVVTPVLTMRDFSDAVLERYLEVEGDELLYCVGACKVEGPGVQLFSRMEGGQDAILGLPLLPVLEALRQRGVLPG